MISIQRGPCPSVLQDIPATSKKYRNKKVVRALWEMQHGKCCYCECKLPAEGHGKTVEHFRPQSVFVYLRNQWKNLLLACAQCNGKKRELFPELLTADDSNPKAVYMNLDDSSVPALIDPSDPNIDPEDHITFIVDDKDEFIGLILPRDGSELGRRSIETIGLSASWYLTKRIGHIANVLLCHWSILIFQRSEGNKAAEDAQLDWFRANLAQEAEFAGVTREFARFVKLKDRFGVEIPKGD